MKPYGALKSQNWCSKCDHDLAQYASKRKARQAGKDQIEEELSDV
jgi:hypothetical protein